MESISSAQNPKIKLLLELQQKSAERRKHGLFVVEGRREVERCINNGYQVDTLFWCPEIFGEEEPVVDGARIFQVSADIYNKVAYRGGTEGVIAEVVAQQHTLDGLQLQKRPLVVVLESVEKPGNVGAILRSADASNVDAVIVCDPQCDLYNPNIIRASVGAFFNVPTVACTSEECIQWLKSHDIQILTAQLQDSNYYYETDMSRATAIVMGTESTGLTDKWRQAANAHIKIPMLGIGDSLNVSVSAAILMFEAVRQRQQSPRR
ncbi:RNA methyltransferase, TrmH family [Prevotellaceae bacterium MN60]|nr:RNA methyltransferase, TrmH family [Prevotellaceae bacterium MN60]